MRLKHPLSDILAGSAHVDVLRALIGLPEGLERSIRDLARRAGVSHPTASRVLHNLAEAGVVRVRRVPPAEYFGLEPDHVLVPTLRSLFAAEAVVLDELRNLVRSRVTSTGAQAWIFGSAARGTMHRGSDVDIALLLPSGSQPDVESTLEALQEEIRRRFGTRASFLVGSGTLEAEVRREASPDGVWHRVRAEGVAI